MVARLRLILVVVIAFIYAAYRFGWPWTGFLNKSLWDWLQLLIIPLVLAAVAFLFNRATTRTEQKIAKERYEQDRQIASQRYEQDQSLSLDKQREDLLQTYLDHMSELLLKEKLRSSKADAEVRNVARVRTITILHQLDVRRIGYIFSFLREAGLMSNRPYDSIINLKNADLSNINFFNANLSKANLSEADLRFANFNFTNLIEANLSEAVLRDANLYSAFLTEANFTKAELRGAILIDANLSGADLSEAKLSKADLSRAILFGAGLNGANLFQANLFQADLREANLNKAYLNEANLNEANLSRANLIDAIVTTEQLDKAMSLKGATMPDGSIHP